ncbi:MAG: hypothetical protein JWQ81_7766 [Amycolatopsis sp.]|uniref:hypothetical protein n=1 Tax=Amycolatopsis sp. TaxID=37632 RepID=UPI0026030A59|nr:hypothetical protein [Amycolatopsis sp.]MCU1687027.1 hypothetical protein [Amycolatopsis sp.]
MLKKAGFVAATAAGLMLVGGTAFAATAAPAQAPAIAAASHMQAGEHHGPFTFWDAFEHFNAGGGALGYGAASLISSAYAGIATTPQLILDSLHHGH